MQVPRCISDDLSQEGGQLDDRWAIGFDGFLGNSDASDQLSQYGVEADGGLSWSLFDRINEEIVEGFGIFYDKEVLLFQEDVDAPGDYSKRTSTPPAMYVAIAGRCLQVCTDFRCSRVLPPFCPARPMRVTIALHFVLGAAGRSRGLENASLVHWSAWL